MQNYGHSEKRLVPTKFVDRRELPDQMSIQGRLGNSGNF
jgi:hypothetical protein